MKGIDPEADPRLPPVYDAENAWGPDDDFFLAVVSQRAGSRVLDLGCGTGRLTIAMAAAGHVVTGVDPNLTSLERARGKAGGDRVTWIQGTSACLRPAMFDAAVLTSHVAQVFVTDEEWEAVLGHLQRSLVPGGVLAFDTRDPRARAWETWTRSATHGYVELADGGRVETWMDVISVADDIVTFEWHNVFADGSDVRGVSTLRFRSEHLVRASLDEAGFTVVDVFGGWRGEPVGPGGGEIVVVARA